MAEVSTVDALGTAGGQLHPKNHITFHDNVAGNISTGTAKKRWLVPFACTVIDVRARLETAPATTAAILDVNKNGTTMFTTQANRPTVAAAGNNSSTTAPDVTALAAGDVLSYDIDQIGTGTVGADLTLVVTAKLLNVD